MNQVEWKQMVVEIEQYINRLERASLSVGELLYDGFQVETVEIFQTYLSGFLEISKSVIVTVESSGKFFPSLKDNVMPLIDDLLSRFEQFQTLLSQERWVALADILKYEIPQQLQSISKVMKESDMK